ncbi:MAG TPA: polymer-forming cytoskeletal protein [Hyphomicrobiaceae bacterium]|nr:polymer-forming cytoskeletal protein [Hyphomicrobiaceae bacterium]
MFTKRTDTEGTGGGAGSGTQRPVVAATEPARGRPLPAAAGAATVVGSELSIKGNLESRGEVQIDGAVEGDVHAMRIVIGEAARITGNLLADDVVVRGAVAGSIRGKKVTLEAASHVEGDIFHRLLAIERGAFFEGRSRRVEDPAAVPRSG